MKLIKCYVENFGKLSGFTYEFTDGCNVIMEDNGYGKTTLAVFLKAMFYGLANTGKTAVAVNERKHYAPWQGGAFGGTLLFEENEKRYLIERFFGEKDKDETFVLYDADTNLVSSDYSSRIGEELFLIDREAFEKSVYMPQACLQTAGNDSISAKISNLAEDEHDIKHFELAKANLEKKQKELLRIGEKGRIWELRHAISDLERKLKEFDAIQENAKLWNAKRQSVKKRQEEAKQRLALLEQELKYVSEYEQKKAKTLHYQELKEKLLNVQKRLAQMQSFFPEAKRECIEEYMQLDVYFDALMMKNEYATKMSVLEVTRAGIEKEKREKKEEIANLKRAYEAAKVETEKVTIVSIIPFVLAVILSLIGIGVFFVQKAIGALLILLGIVVAGVWIHKKQKQTHRNNAMLKKQREEKEQIQKRMNQAQKELYETDAGFHACEEELVKVQRIWYEKTEILVHFFEEFENYKFIKESEYMTCLSEIKEKAALCLSLQEELKTQKERIQQFELGDAEMIQLEPQRSLEAVQKEQNECYQKLQNLIEEKSQINRQLEALSMQLEQQEDIRSELAHEREELIECENKYEILSKTIKYLERAKDLFSTRYLTKLQESFNEYMEILNEEVLGETVVDAKLKLKITQSGKKKEPDYFSAGYRDLMNLCMRFAMVDALYEKEKPFLILDDPFVNMDDKKLKRALAFVKRLSRKHQIIYFTCHESRK